MADLGMPYRDGLAVARERYEADLRALRQRVESMSGRERHAFPSSIRTEIDGLVSALDKPPRCLEEADAALKRVAELKLALGVADEFQQMKERARRQRRRRATGAAVVAALVGVAGAIVALDFWGELKQLDARCAVDSSCRSTGRCHANPRYLVRNLPYYEACIAQSAGDCVGPCKDSGLCAAREGRCVAVDDAACLASDGCRSYGWCRVDGDSCGRTTDEDCRASAACREFAQCSSFGRGCHVELDQDCAASKYCREEGRCTVLAGECVPAAVKQCKLGRPCELDGLCSAGEGGGCEAQTDGDCRFSDGCFGEGRCTARDGNCVVRSDADCLRSDACSRERRCTASEGRCVERAEAHPVR